MSGVDVAVPAGEDLNGKQGLPALPEPGQVVEVRGSMWAVSGVWEQGLPRSPADESLAHLSHVIDLQSLDERSLGAQLSVVWELEVGHTVTPAQGLPELIYPDGFDEPELGIGTRRQRAQRESDRLARFRVVHILRG